MEAYIYDFVRTPRGRSGRGGSLREITPVHLAATVLRALRDRNGLDTALVDDVALGCVGPVGEQGSDIARTAVLVAGYDSSVPGVQMHRYCSSGLETCNTAAAQIACGQNELAIAGGVESLSRVPLLADGGAGAGSRRRVWQGGALAPAGGTGRGRGTFRALGRARGGRQRHGSAGLR